MAAAAGVFQLLGGESAARASISFHLLHAAFEEPPGPAAQAGEAEVKAQQNVWEEAILLLLMVEASEQLHLLETKLMMLCCFSLCLLLMARSLAMMAESSTSGFSKQ